MAPSQPKMFIKSCPHSIINFLVFNCDLNKKVLASSRVKRESVKLLCTKLSRDHHVDVNQTGGEVLVKGKLTTTDKRKRKKNNDMITFVSIL